MAVPVATSWRENYGAQQRRERMPCTELATSVVTVTLACLTFSRVFVSRVPPLAERVHSDGAWLVEVLLYSCTCVPTTSSFASTSSSSWRHVLNRYHYRLVVWQSLAFLRPESPLPRVRPDSPLAVHVEANAQPSRRCVKNSRYNCQRPSAGHVGQDGLVELTFRFLENVFQKPQSQFH